MIFMVLATFVSWTAIIIFMVLALRPWTAIIKFMVLVVYRLMDGHNLIYGLSNLRLIDGHNHIYGLSDLLS